MSITLSICIVLYKPNSESLTKTLDSLLLAAERLPSDNRIQLYIVDNSPELSIDKDGHSVFSAIPTKIIHGQGNVGFGRANNIVLANAIGRYHLVLNPDVELAPSALQEAIKFMEQEAQCGLLTPSATYPDGRKQFLYKQYPSLLDLFLRGFAPGPVRDLFHKRLEKYEMRQFTGAAVYWDPPVVSGCFMFFRGDVFSRLKGFDPRYFLYFEDFDISLRAGHICSIAYVPTVEIVHEGGNAARKGLKHIQLFLKSAGIFFLTHGLKVW
ncbi:glycosyltransferase family 2 protein [Falsochrobactrum ovis]|uniref:Glycosyltransferase 2-like domain-containing protein n=1 Tax=Falsochrobactrum ovis TaxID=1293442 RepID=A0A364JY28_9HYPH|nr:glycosyltransferase family 2 protein [Falsochrobactrum ovis]RAK32200.1 hypothetical protein C7374_102200 [Falsochrobactrum ovis]